MGCSSSTNSTVEPLTPEDVNGDEDETGSKLDGRGDSAVSKGTTDSGVVMEHREIPPLPGVVPTRLPPLTSVRESEADRQTQDGLRQNSSEILKELLSEGIIPVGPARERGPGGGESYCIMLDDSEGVRRRPPARLESLKARDLPSKEEIEEKIRLAEERRKLKEDELKTRLRAKSARVRSRATTSSAEEDAALTPVVPLQSSLSPDHTDPPPHSQVLAEGSENRGDGEEGKKEMGSVVRREGRVEGRGDNRGDGGAKRVSEDGVREKEEKEELTQVEELEKAWFLSALKELDNDSSFQRAEEGRVEGRGSGDNRGDGGAERVSEDGVREKEELTQVEELEKARFLSALRELDNDSSFQRAEDKEEIF
ncbi:Stathmin domain-containing protein 1 [Collichthys lucidus]|uniref:Stathmin domain-containing protein 1 n=1 Tax=Collichthys lucidus TaxID=240159 RepID=A0A4U5VJ89_COLLU|nr:Stathmin domain-containing protein 1 [Collichthys lucidus]